MRDEDYELLLKRESEMKNLEKKSWWKVFVIMFKIMFGIK